VGEQSRACCRQRGARPCAGARCEHCHHRTAPHGSSITNILTARIAEIKDEGPDRVNLRLAVGGEHILQSRITRRSRDQLGLAVGMEVFAQVKSVALIA
jgi:molybdopterin-binding protein